MATATVRFHVALIEWDRSETPSLFFGQSYAEVAREAAKAATGYVSDDDPEFWNQPGRSAEDIDRMTVSELVELHADFREAVTVPWVTFFEQDLEVAIARTGQVL